MTKYKAIIFDLDNTIYAVESIGESLFSSLFQLIEREGNYQGDMEAIKKAIQRKPFQVVSKEFHFSEKLTENCLRLLSNLEYNDIIKPFDDYALIKKIDCLKFLVTTGFEKLQKSKIRQLNLENDFTEYFIIDPSVSSLTKKDIFKNIKQQYNLSSREMLVIGDDIDSEIQAGKELGIDTIVYDYNNSHQNLKDYVIITNYNQLNKLKKIL